MTIYRFDECQKCKYNYIHEVVKMLDKIKQIALLNISENASKLGVNRITFKKIITGESCLKAKDARKLAEILCVKVEEILEFEEKKQQKNK